MANPNSKSRLAPIREEEEDSDFEAPQPKTEQKREARELVRISPRPGFAVLDTEKGRKEKPLPSDVEDEGLRAKSERKRVRAEVHLGPKLTGALEGDERFEEDAVQAAENYSIKRKKKYKFTEDGIPIEPFSVREEQESHIFDSTIVKDAKKDGSWDPWLLSVEEDMKRLEREDAQKEENSEAESEGDDKGEEEDVEPLLEGEEEESKETAGDEKKLRLLEEICKLLLQEETVNKALIRLKGKPEIKHANFKKNVRKGAAEKESQPLGQSQKGNIEEFEKLMGLAGKVFDIGYISNLSSSFDNTQIAVYTDPKEDLEFEAKQLKAMLERKKNREKASQEDAKQQ